MHLLNRLGRFALIVLLPSLGLVGCAKGQPESAGPGSPAKATPEQSSTPAPQPKTFLSGLETPVGLAVSPDGKYVAILGTGKSKNAQVWNTASGKRIYEADFPTGSSLPVAIAPDSKTAAFSNQAGSCIVLVDLASAKEVRRLEGKEKGLGLMNYGLSISPAGDLLVTASDNSIFGWDPKTGAQKFIWKTGENDIHEMSDLFDGGKKVLLGDKKGTLALWDLAAGKPVWTRAGAFREQVDKIAVAPDGKTALVKAFIDSPQVWELTKAEKQKALDIRIGVLEPVPVFLPDNQTIVYGNGPNVLFLNLSSGSTRDLATGHGKSLMRLALGGKGTLLATASEDGTVKVWELPPSQ